MDCSNDVKFSCKSGQKKFLNYRNADYGNVGCDIQINTVVRCVTSL
jgi:hypothetical protein